MRIRHYWRKHLEEHAPMHVRAALCDAAGTVALLSKEPQESLGWFSRFIAFLTTPFKQGTLVTFGGALVVDTDGPFLEIHPDGEFGQPS